MIFGVFVSDLDTMRLDKWLKITRFYKQREKAAEYVAKGHVKVNHERVKPSKMIKRGDLITVKRDNTYHDYKVLSLSLKSVSAEIAREMYEEIEKEIKVSKEKSELMKIIEEQDKKNLKEMRGKGRPTKRDRRILNRYKYGD